MGVEDYRSICGRDELPPGKARRAEIDGLAIAIFNVDGVLYAIEDTCLHAGGPLSEGRVEGTIVTCPWHDWRYDLQTGCTPLNHKISLSCFPVRVRGGTIEVSPRPS